MAQGFMLALLVVLVVFGSLVMSAESRGNPTCLVGRRAVPVASNCVIPGTRPPKQNYGIYVRGAGGRCVCKKYQAPKPKPGPPTRGNPVCKRPAGAIVASNCIINAARGLFGVWRLTNKALGYCSCVRP